MAPGGGWSAPVIRIAIDTLGGDAPLDVLVAGALDAAAGVRQPGRDRERRSFERQPPKLLFFGDGRAIAPLIEGSEHDIVHSPRRLELGDSLRGALRGEVGSSMRSALCAVADGDADAVVTAGSTGGLMALSRHLVGMLRGIRRPAIAKAFSAQTDGVFHMLDLGASIGADEGQLHQYARLGDVVAGADAPSPRVALLNIGSELRKGPAQVRAAARLLDADPKLRYVGFVEADRLFDGDVDVVVTDGYVGNVALKAAEGAAHMARHILAREFADRTPAVVLAKMLFRGRLERVRSAYNPQRYNGAGLLGLQGVVVKSHGRADRQGFASAVRQAMDALSSGLVAKLAAGIEQ